MNLRLLGAQTIKDVVPAMVDTSNIHSHLVAVPHDVLYNSNCMSLLDHPILTRSDRLFRRGFATRTSSRYQGEDKALGPIQNLLDDSDTPTLNIFERGLFTTPCIGTRHRISSPVDLLCKVANYIIGYRIPICWLCYSALGTIDR